MATETRYWEGEKSVVVRGVGRVRYAVDAEIYGGRETWKAVLVYGIEETEKKLKPLRWYNFIKLRRIAEAILEIEGRQALVDENGRYRINFEID